MKIAERTATWRRERRVLARFCRAAWRLEQAERERSWALASAHAEDVFFEVPDTPSLLFVVGNAGTQDGKPILAIDPDNLVAKPVCDGSAAFC